MHAALDGTAVWRRWRGRAYVTENVRHHSGASLAGRRPGDGDATLRRPIERAAVPTGRLSQHDAAVVPEYRFHSVSHERTAGGSARNGDTTRYFAGLQL